MTDDARPDAPPAPRLLERRAHGVVVGMPLPDVLRAPHLLPGLRNEERALTTTWGELRVRTFAAGRLALRGALREAGVDVAGPILKDARGAPLLPPGVLASISHKDEIAIAIARIDEGSGARIGVDVELLDDDRARRVDVSRHVLTERELAELAVLGSDEERRRELLARFSLKESLYKALDPFVQRYVGFLEVEARPRIDGTASFALSLTKGEGPFEVDGAWAVTTDPLPCVITSVRVRRP